MSLTVDERWEIVKSFFKLRGLVRQHLDSFNDFLRNKLQQIIDEQGEIITEIPGLKIKLGKIRYDRPGIRETDKGPPKELTPLEARLRNLTYAVPLYLTMIPIENNIEGEPIEVYIGDLPIMLKSIADPTSNMTYDELIKIGEDPKDPGGYFIVNGTEKVIVAQEDLATNRVLVDYGKSGSNITHVAKITSAAAGYRVQVVIERLKDSSIQVSFATVPGKIPFVIMMRALGFTTDKDIVYAVSLDPEIQNELLPSLEQASSITTVEDALDFIGNRIAIGQKRENRIQRAEQIIDKYFLPHIGTSPEDRKKKGYYLAAAVNKLLELYLGRRQPDDKDHYANKRVRLAGDLFTSLFRVAFKAFVKDLVYQLEKAKVRGRRLSLTALVRADIITERVRHALATGNWVGGRTGVSQLLDRTNWLSMLSHLRRVVSSLARGQPNFEARDLHGTQWGRMCPFETPEGPNSGLVKNLALLAQVSVGINESSIEKVIYEQGVISQEELIERLSAEEDINKYLNWSKVYLNGRLLGYYPDGKELAEKIRELRRSSKISDEVNVAHIVTEYINEVHINCDGGRVRRPLIVVKDGKPLVSEEDIEKLRKGEITFDDLVKQGKIEFLDAEEEENAYIALNPQDLTKDHTHLEIWPPAILGITASIIPYPEHNQSPRNTYQSAMAKQALGLYAANYQLRTDTRAHLLHYPQKPLVGTKILDIIGYNDRPAGNNAILAVMSYTGYNMEDAIIMNKSSVERGMYRSTFFRLYSTEELKYPGGQEDKIMKPEPGTKGYKGNEYYRLLEDNGIVSPEVEVKGGDVLIGKVSPPRFLQEFKELSPEQSKRDTSIVTRHGEMGIVDLVLVTESSEGNKLVKVRVRDLRIPEIGDKFATRHGQKGVIGMLIDQADMPYTVKGVVPDIILNPHALPSRMTIGQIMEALAGKYVALTGKPVDATPFIESPPLEEIRKGIRESGFLPDGTEVVYDGRTGQKLKGRILFGIVYYQKLHHMVADKMHARARGPVQILTRQPTEGRAREGGLRFGEMERDCLIGFGTAMLIKDRLLDNSDKATIYVCDKCGYIGWYDRTRNKYVCPIHGENANLYPVTVSYAFKLLLQELMSMVISPRLVLGDKVSVGGENNE
ncbi:DNA-directed RNA polymerase subunit B [Sulfurisphaera ohwakuensis]|uniref:DNA-directed RNA polymerase subunit beta n=1 Tax=Sulfurisphaera ohwakuensis TaxID=69656 RepID=A0A650CDP3_SULOH|nr:DNA-directed RNA polymerase subunit B [Sulfurisphaera ohwakuensis]MBB5253184.1 DNA-directed RNA polymerase subunit B [Sulfurisphaera ohwakuensis]QGR15904.1 DNA-directed RNA polymerase subunit B [Sulfurisphaera ohwakuensis]